MGIPGYSAFFKEEYPSAVTSFKWRQQHATVGASAAQRPAVSLVSPTSAAEEVVIQNRHYDHLLFDINQFLYSAAAKSENEEQVFVRTFSQLNRIFQIFRPHASVFLAQDGPAPVAKFMTQRERRVKKVEKAKAKEELLSMSSFEEEAEEEDESKGAEEDEAEEEGEAVSETIATNGKRFDPINFTPGTPFMQRLKQALCYFACQRLNQLPLQNVAFYVSGSDREGEGELKIFEYLTYNESVLSTDRCLVVGNDADLILYAMMAYTNVDILQYDYGTYHLFNMSTFKKLLHQQVPNAPLEELLMDLTFISLLAGNDYLPKLRGLSLPETWKSYLHLRTTKEYENKRLFNLEESHLDVPFFAQIWAMQKFQIALKDSRKSEQNVRSIFHYMRSKYLVGSAASNLFQKEKSEQGSKLLTYSLKLNGVKLGTATAKSGKEAQTMLCRQALGILNEDSESSKVTIDASSSPLFKMMKEQHKGITEDFYYSAIANYWDDITVIGVDSVVSTIENQVTKIYQRKKKNTELITALSPEQIASRVKQYMQGIVWAMHYLQGKCIDYSYHYPLAISPQPTEIIEHVPHVDFRCAHSDTTPPLPLPFLMALLPSNSPHLKSHLPEAYQHLLETSSELADLYHGETEEQWASTSPLSLFERLKASIHKVTKTLKQQKAEQTQKHSHLLEFQPTLLFRKIHQQKQPQTFHKHNNNDRQRFDDISDMYRKDPRRLHSAVPEGLVEPPVGRFRPLNHTHLLSCYQEKRGEKGIFSPSNIFVPIQQVRRFSSLRPFATTVRLPHILSHPPLTMMKRNRWTGLAAFTTGMAARALKV